MQATSDMLSEIHEIPAVIERLIRDTEGQIIQIAQEIEKRKPMLVTTVARGSSDHAANYLKYAMELCASVPVASLGPSVSSVYGRRLKLDNAVNISISQSGKSPDILCMNEMVSKSGALDIVITNDEDSPLARQGKHVINMTAGKEKSIAATKTFVASVVSGLLLLAHWQGDQELIASIKKLPEKAYEAIKCDWSELSGRLRGKDELYIIGRGASFSIAREAALKFKEICQINAAAYSSAEVMHGPRSIIDDGFIILALMVKDKAENSVIEVLKNLAGQGARIYATTDENIPAVRLPHVDVGHPLVDPLLRIVSFYMLIENHARIRGVNPDIPPNLKKVTETT